MQILTTNMIQDDPPKIKPPLHSTKKGDRSLPFGYFFLCSSKYSHTPMASVTAKISEMHIISNIVSLRVFLLMIYVDVGNRGIEMYLIMIRVCGCSCYIFNHINYILIKIYIVFLVLVFANLTSNNKLVRTVVR